MKGAATVSISLSVIMFYGGLAGVALFIVAGLISALVLRKKGRKLRETINNEYE